MDKRKALAGPTQDSGWQNGMKTSWRGSFHLLLIAELMAIFLLVPLLVWRQWLPVPLIILPLYVFTVYGVLWLRTHGYSKLRQVWLGDGAEAGQAVIKAIALRFILVVFLVWVVVYIFYPEKLFFLPTEKPIVWLLIMLLYPPLSVLPQEILYRSFFFARYAEIFPNRNIMVIVNTLAFAFMHIVFGNAIALLSTLIGGYFFASTYARTRSLKVVCLEHTLYGSVIFTFGLGEFFVFGVAQKFITG